MNKFKLALTSLAIPIMSLESIAQVNRLSSPEEEVLSSFDRLDALETRLRSERQIANSKGYGDAPISAIKSFKRSLDAFESREYLAALRNIEYYFEKTNIPNHAKHTMGHLIAARSSKAVQQYDKSVDHYINYLSFATKPNAATPAEIRNAVAELLDITSQSTVSKSYRLGHVLTAVVFLDVPQEFKAEILFLAAKTATNANMPELAEKWIQESQLTTNSSNLKMKGLYYKALIEISKNDLEKARQTLLEALEDDSIKTTNEYSLTVMALARVEYSIGDYKAAIKAYKKIPDTSLSYTDATYEQIFAHYKANDLSSAYEQAKIYVQKNPSAENIRFANNLVSYLGVKSGKILVTEMKITRDISFLSKFSNELNSRFEGETSISKATLENLKTDSEAFSGQSPYLEKAIFLFSKAEELEDKAAEIQGDLTTLLVNLWDSRLHDIFPSHIERAEQLRQSVYELLDIGHRLSASELQLASSKLTSSDKISIERSSNRRIKLLSKHSNFKRYHQTMQPLVKSINLNTQLASLQNEIQIANMYIRSSSLITDKDKNDTYKLDLNALRTRHKNASIKLAGAIASQRSQYIKEIYLQSPIRTTKQLMTSYALDLITESRMLADWRGKISDSVTKKLSWGYEDAWKKWIQAADYTFSLLSDEENRLKLSTLELTKTIAKIQAQKQQAQMNIYTLRSKLESILGNEYGLLVNHYQSSVDRRIAEKQKWLADLEWLKFREIEDEMNGLEDDYKQSKTILDENLTDQMRGIEE